MGSEERAQLAGCEVLDQVEELVCPDELAQVESRFDGGDDPELEDRAAGADRFYRLDGHLGSSQRQLERALAAEHKAKAAGEGSPALDVIGRLGVRCRPVDHSPRFVEITAVDVHLHRVNHVERHRPHRQRARGRLDFLGPLDGFLPLAETDEQRDLAAQQVRLPAPVAGQPGELQRWSGQSQRLDVPIGRLKAVHEIVVGAQGRLMAAIVEGHLQRVLEEHARFLPAVDEKQHHRLRVERL